MGKKVFVLMNPYTVVECNLTRGLLLLCRYVCDLYKGTCENYIKDFLPIMKSIDFVTWYIG